MKYMALVKLTRVLWNVRYPEHSSCRNVFLMKVFFYLLIFVLNFTGTFISLRCFFNHEKWEKNIIEPIR